MRTAIVTDSTAYIPKDLRTQYDIHMIPLSVVFGDEVYQEENEITASDFYEMVERLDMLPTTSQPATGKFVEKYEELAKDYDAVISIHLSSGISGTYQGAITAGEMVDDIKVYAFDSEITCMIQGLFVLEAAKMAKEGKHPDEIIARLHELRESSNAYFMVDDLSNLQRGGRLNGAAALIGSLLQVKPILHFENKVIVPFEKIRTKKKALKRIVELFEQEYKKGEPLQAVLIHGNIEEEATEMLNELKEKFPEAEFRLSYFGAVISTHLGQGATGLGWTKRYN
ncbi:DegV family protein [Pradoshia sp. D12]|uniref:DegV family protein n=1 Tax=Bacillaceae TaxID=186817 RepID=UPI00080AE4EB|nr:MULTISPECIES: DegV family protein [Bacillaceae]OCA84666.1 fatty acid-binding protein DegV [Bacillus sp. FJAT-27986]QFK72876.1 DegV family protein [Pradoshia sp. D12]TPF71868.1 DegV family protein [Bacillus sp. D12]